MTQPPIYLEDLTVGDQFTSGEHAMDEAQITSFAAQFDPQPFHLDDAAARDTLFGGLAASGWHTAAITMRLQVTSGLSIAGGIIAPAAYPETVTRRDGSGRVWMRHYPPEPRAAGSSP